MDFACHTRIDRSSKFLQQPEQQGAAFACFKKSGGGGGREKNNEEQLVLFLFIDVNSNRSQLTETNNMILKNRPYPPIPCHPSPHKNLSTLQPN